MELGLIVSKIRFSHGVIFADQACFLLIFMVCCFHGDFVIFMRNQICFHNFSKKENWLHMFVTYEMFVTHVHNV